MLRRYLACLACTGAIASMSLSARAQTEAEGLALNRFDPSERGSEWFVSESLDLRGHQRFAAGLVLDYARKPLVLYDQEGDEISTIVGDQFYGHAGGTIVLWDRVRFALSLPVAIYQDGDGGFAGNEQFELGSNVAVGDLRLGGDVRLVGVYGDPITLAAGLQLFAPTGSQDAYTGDGTVRAMPRVMVAGDVQPVVYAAKIGMNLRPRDEDFAGSPMGSELTFAAAAGFRLEDDRLVIGPEIYGSTVFTDSDAFFAKRTTPFEILLGTHYLATEAVRLGLGFGPGLTRAFGTPQFRVLGSIEFVQPIDKPPPPPPAPPSDRDGDGIVDYQDACPDQPGVATDDPQTNGCPPPEDRDGDGIFDADDACPDQPGEKTDDPKTNGCPPPDRDKDGILDADDACPDEAGVKTDDPKTNGCPPPKDRDGDGILDEEDACPDAAGEKNEDPKKNGCPIARIEKGQIRIREQVQFAYNSAQLLKASDFVLEAVHKILVENPEITLIEIQGHTDDKGSDQYNKGLSQRRAQSVQNWLANKGIDKKRLKAVGYGEAEPLYSNDTEDGRANNRRVEFHIIEQKPGTVEVVEPPGTGSPGKAAPKSDAMPPVGTKK